MKIGIISNLYPPYARGGAEYVIVRTVEALTDLQHDIFIISAGPKKQEGHIVYEDRTPTEHVYRFFPRNLYFILDDYKKFLHTRMLWHIIDTFTSFGRRRVEDILDTEEPEVVITHNLKGIGLSIPHGIQAKNYPHVHIVHDLQLIYPSGLLFAGKERLPLVTRPFYALYRAICKWKLGKPDIVIFPSNYLKDVYLSHGFFKDSEVVMMPNPAPKLNPVARVQRSPGPLRLLFVGQLENHKGINFLLEEFSKLEIDAQLIIAGEGTCAKQVKRASEKDERIIYLGFVSMDQLANCFGIADGLIVPSLCYENSPTVIYESLHAGVPVVASDIGGVGELVQDGENGFLFKPGSKSGFVRALWRLDEKKDEFGKKQSAIQETVAPYKISLYAQQLIERLKEAKDRHANDGIQRSLQTDSQH